MENKKNLEDITTLGTRVVGITGTINKDVVDGMRKHIVQLMDKSLTEEIYLFIDTTGGGLGAALIGYDFLKAIPTPVTAIVNGYCKSAGLELLAGCKKRLSLPNSMFYFHSFFKTFDFKSDVDFTEAFKEYEKDFLSLKKRFYELNQKEFSLDGMTLEKMNKLGDVYDRHYSAEEMKEMGVIHEVITEFPFFKK